MNTDRIYRVLFLSRRNSARSIMAEAILNKVGAGRFEAFSAAVEPGAAVEPAVVDLLATADMAVAAKPKHYRDFVAPGAPELDFVFTLSDTAAGEPLPEWPGGPITAHWHSDDPMKLEPGSLEYKRTLVRLMSELERRLNVFVSLPFSSLDRMSLQAQVRDLAESGSP